MSQEFITFDADQIHALRESSTARIIAFGPAPPEINQIHLFPERQALSTSASSVGGDGSVALHGALGPIPYEFTLKLKLDITQISVTFDMNKPIDMPPYTWTFALGGVRKDATGAVIGAGDVTLVPEATPAFYVVGTPQAAAPRPFLCILKCAGIAILPVLIKCLPSLAGGPPAYVACVVASAGEAAAGIAACVASCLG
jgi:hypothetical protein